MLGSSSGRLWAAGSRFLENAGAGTISQKLESSFSLDQEKSWTRFESDKSDRAGPFSFSRKPSAEIVTTPKRLVGGTGKAI